MEIKPDGERMFNRIHFKRYVDVEFISDMHARCQVKDLSLSGMFVLGDFRQHAEENCHLNLVQEGISTGLNLRALARVVRKEEKGMAVEFRSMTYDSYMYLQASLLNETEDSLLRQKMLGEDCPFEITDQPQESREPIFFLG